MFKHRIKILLFASVLVAAVLIWRLGDLQVRGGQAAREKLAIEQIAPYRPVPATRGRILARGPGREGTVKLVDNQPSFELRVYYPIMDPDRQWSQAQLRQIRRERAGEEQAGRPAGSARDELAARIRNVWDRLSELTGVDAAELAARRDATVTVVRRIVDAVEAKLRRERRLPDGQDLDYPILEQRMYHPLVTDLTNEQQVRLRLGLPNHPWVKVSPATSRVYCRGHTLCHILGRTEKIPGTVSPSREIRQADYMPGEMWGREKLELAYDDTLSGKRGWVQLEEPPVIKPEPIDGQDIILIIDIALQEYCEKILRKQVAELKYATAGAAVVLDLRDNSLLALASVPTYDISSFSEDYDDLVSDHLHIPLLNRALMGQYPPGSIVKPLVALVGLQLGAITPRTEFFCCGRLSPKIPRFRCWNHYGHQYVDVIEAISQSCDVFFYRVGEEIGAERLARCYHTFGFGADPPGMKLSCAGGRVPSQEWSLKRFKHGLRIGDARNLGIGQGYLTITPIQAANMLSTLLTGELRPVRLVEGEDLPPATRVNVDPRYQRLVLTGMDNAVNAVKGTARKYAHTDQVHVAGKTGSAQAGERRAYRWSVNYRDAAGNWHAAVTEAPNRLIRELEAHNPPVTNISKNAVAWHPVLTEEDRLKRDDPERPNEPAHAWFIGFAPFENPRVVVVAMIEYGMAGGSGTGPVFKDIVLKCRELGYVQ